MEKHEKPRGGAQERELFLPASCLITTALSENCDM